MDERTRLLQSLDESRAAMRRVVAGIDPGMVLYPDWTIKKVLAHITGWDETAIKALEAHMEGAGAEIPDYRGVDHYNQRLVAERDHDDDEQVHSEWERVRERLRKTLSALPDDKVGQQIWIPWQFGYGSVAQLIHVLTEHEHEHAEEIEQKIDEENHNRD